MMTEEQWAKENGKAIVTIAECEEVVWAIDTLRSYCEDYQGITISDLVYRDQSESQRLRDAAEKAEHKEKQIVKAKGVLEKWRKRVEAIMGTKP